MKTKTSLLMLMMLSYIILDTYSQTTLTNKQVYDFEVGDIIQSESSMNKYSSVTPPTYETKTILKKVFTIATDTVLTYTIKRDYYTPANCQGCNATYFTDTVKQIITDLNAVAYLNNLTTCLDIHDTVYKDYGDKLVWERSPKEDITHNCFEPTIETSKLIQGVGGPFYSRLEPEGPISFDNILIYYKKSSESWGYRVTSIKNKEVPDELSEIYPNPTTNILNIRYPEKFISYDLINCAGKSIRNEKINNHYIDLTAVSSGIYILRLHERNSKVLNKIIQKL